MITVLHNFIGSDGETPLAGLVQASDGNFYGVASAGGSLGYGTIFRVTSTWDHTFSLLHDFDQTHGQSPQVALFQNTNGILYGDTFQGGADGAGAFYSLNVSAAQFASLQNLRGKVGSTVSILGQGFTGSTAVSFGGVNATTFTVVSDKYVTAKVPTGGPERDSHSCPPSLNSTTRPILCPMREEPERLLSSSIRIAWLRRHLNTRTGRLSRIGLAQYWNAHPNSPRKFEARCGPVVLDSWA